MNFSVHIVAVDGLIENSHGGKSLYRMKFSLYGIWIYKY